MSFLMIGFSFYRFFSQLNLYIWHRTESSLFSFSFFAFSFHFLFLRWCELQIYTDALCQSVERKFIALFEWVRKVSVLIKRFRSFFPFFLFQSAILVYFFLFLFCFATHHNHNHLKMWELVAFICIVCSLISFFRTIILSLRIFFFRLWVRRLPLKYSYSENFVKIRTLKLNASIQEILIISFFFLFGKRKTKNELNEICDVVLNFLINTWRTEYHQLMKSKIFALFSFHICRIVQELIFFATQINYHRLSFVFARFDTDIASPNTRKWGIFLLVSVHINEAVNFEFRMCSISWNICLQCEIWGSQNIFLVILGIDILPQINLMKMNIFFFEIPFHGNLSLLSVGSNNINSRLEKKNKKKRGNEFRSGYEEWS